MYAVGTRIDLTNTSPEFSANSAENGGAMYLSTAATLTLSFSSILHMSNNTAEKYGGAFYVRDSPTPTQCSFQGQRNSEEYRDDHYLSLPECFISPKFYYKGVIESHYDIAWRDGNFIYGGLLDKCKPETPRTEGSFSEYNFITNYTTYY